MDTKTQGAKATARKLRPRQNPIVKLVLEMGPLVLFFLANMRPHWFEPLVGPFLPAALTSGARAGIFTGTAVLMVAVVVATIASYALTRHLPTMPVVTVVFALVMGGLTLYFQDATFIKLKPTIVNCLFGLALLGALAFGKLLLPIMLDSVLEISEEGWRKLTLRWGLFFFFLAGLNELVWRNTSDQFWSAFKAFGTMPITIIFALSQVPLILKHEIKNADAPPPERW